jgi:hypothetical protein
MELIAASVTTIPEQLFPRSELMRAEGRKCGNMLHGKFGCDWYDSVHVSLWFFPQPHRPSEFDTVLHLKTSF